MTKEYEKALQDYAAYGGGGMDDWFREDLLEARRNASRAKHETSATTAHNMAAQPQSPILPEGLVSLSRTPSPEGSTQKAPEPSKPTKWRRIKSAFGL
jgi:hypothetical protein